MTATNDRAAQVARELMQEFDQENNFARLETEIARRLREETKRLQMAVYELKDAIQAVQKETHYFCTNWIIFGYLNDVCDRHDQPHDIYTIQKEHHA